MTMVTTGKNVFLTPKLSLLLLLAITLAALLATGALSGIIILPAGNMGLALSTLELPVALLTIALGLQILISAFTSSGIVKSSVFFASAFAVCVITISVLTVIKLIM